VVVSQRKNSGPCHTVEGGDDLNLSGLNRRNTPSKSGYEQKAPGFPTMQIYQNSKLIEKDTMSDENGDNARTKFPEAGSRWEDLQEELIRAKDHDIDWRNGRLPLYNYYRDEKLLRVVQESYSLYQNENALGKTAFPSLAKLETEVLDMGLSLFNAPPEAGASFTSGGSESIFLAVCGARNAKAVTGRPNIVACETLHPAFNKAAEFLGLDVIRTPMAGDYHAQPAAMESAVNENTVMMAASAPSFVHGAFDPIAEIGAVAQRHNLWFHVDSCLGGFLAPFWREIGQPVPQFDFSVPTVTSLSADLHKHGFAARGASLLMVRDAGLKQHYGFEFGGWPSGIYATETFTGSRPGGSVAAAWAVLKYLGRAGYQENARMVLDAKTRLTAGISAIEGLEVVSPLEFTSFLYRSTDPSLDLDALADLLGDAGWYAVRNANPKAIQLSLNPIHASSADDYIAAVRVASNEVRSKGLRGVENLRTY